ncbi:MAG TPA: septum formation protein Maf [Firmicutes bacterium]|nr:septum formation protein Maf [Bacillota bacterium]
MDLILASQSPRRKALLQHFGLEFTVKTEPVEETEEGQPQKAAEINACAKALAVSRLYPNALVLGADTVVVLGNALLGKPKDMQDAEDMLRLLSGREHEVTTVVALARAGKTAAVFQETTVVFFRQLSQAEISGYAKTGEPLDKAGAYGIQGFGGLLVERIKGCYYNVMGLPMPRLAVELRKLGLEVMP